MNARSRRIKHDRRRPHRGRTAAQAAMLHRARTRARCRTARVTPRSWRIR